MLKSRRFTKQCFVVSFGSEFQGEVFSVVHFIAIAIKMIK
jgi:hypothetical protein